MNRTQRILLACAFALGVGRTGDAGADTRYWDNDANDNDWFNAVNWNPNGTPAISDQVFILAGSPNTTTDVLTDGNGIITVDGSSASAAFFDLYAGYASAGSLSILNGATVSTEIAFVGHQAGSTGAVTVDGSGSTWSLWGNGMDANYDLFVGYNGDGSLTIQDGGTVSNSSWGYLGYNAGSSGTMIVKGAGSTYEGSWRDLSVGYAGTGVLEIIDGGKVISRWPSVADKPGSQGTVVISGPDSSWISRGTSRIGDFGTGRMFVQNGGSVAGVRFSVGSYGDSDGTIVVEGEGSTLSLESSLAVGGKGTGTLHIRAGGSVLSGGGVGIGGADGADDGVDGMLIIEGPGSSLTVSTRVADDALVVGGSTPWGDNFGRGVVTVTNGGTLITDSARLAADHYSEGTVTIDGSGSIWTANGDIVVGQFGTGVLNVVNGGTLVSSKTFLIASSRVTVGTVIIDGPGSTWTVGPTPFDSTIGFSGEAVIQITNGGSMSVTTTDTANSEGMVYMAIQEDSNATVIVDGTGSSWSVSNGLYIGGKHRIAGGSAEVLITNGGLATVGKIVGMWQTGRITVNGGRFVIGSNPAEGLPDALTVGADGELHSGGVIDGDLYNRGTVGAGNAWLAYPSQSTEWRSTRGHLGVHGDFTQDIGGTLVIELEGTDEGQFDVMSVTGEADLSGTLVIDFVDGYKPSVGDSFDVLLFGSRVGEFDDILGLWFRYDMSLVPIWGDDRLTLVVPIIADVNASGYVDDDDLSILLANWNARTSWDIGDLDGSGNVDDGDLSLLLANWGTGTPPMGRSAVPEPATLSLLVLGGLALIRRRR